MLSNLQDEYSLKAQRALSHYSNSSLSLMTIQCLSKKFMMKSTPLEENHLMVKHLSFPGRNFQIDSFLKTDLNQGQMNLIKP